MIDRIAHWFAYRIPRRVVYWCAIRLMVHATVGRYSSQVVPDLTAGDALEMWEKGHG